MGIHGNSVGHVVNHTTVSNTLHRVLVPLFFLSDSVCEYLICDLMGDLDV